MEIRFQSKIVKEKTLKNYKRENEKDRYGVY